MPELTQAIKDAVTDVWGLDLETCRSLGGSTGLNLLAEGPFGRQVVRIHRAHVSQSRVHALQEAREVAFAAGIPVARAVAGRNAERCVVVDGLAVEVEGFIDSDGWMSTFDHIRVALPVLARLHDALADADLPEAGDDLKFANYLSSAEALSKTGQGAIRLRRLSSRLGPLADLAESLAEAVTAAEADNGPLPSQWCHGDFWDNNVLFRSGHVVLVADFGFMNRRPRVDDLALSLYFTWWQLTVAGEPNPKELIADLIAAYETGTTRPLSEQERRAIPLVLARQPLWSIGVWGVLLDDPDEVAAHLEGHADALQLGLGLIRDAGC